jgi:pimeloyl-ACP methyl ester carboxylesterase
MPGLSTPRLSLSWVRTVFAIVFVAVLAPGGAQALAAPGPTLSALHTAGAAEVQNVYIRPPQSVPDDQPVQVLIALHGMGGNGRDFGGALAAQADAHGWLIVAPTIRYGDWTNPDQIVHEDPSLVAWLSDYVRHLADRTGFAVQPRVLLFGHSRGAQLALRFTEIHPDEVAGVAAASAGTYTLPLAMDTRTGEVLQFPFGVADLAQADGGQAFDAQTFDAVPIWIGVGGGDTNDADVPDAWDQYIGTDRLDRARAFSQALQNSGANVSLMVFQNTDHTLTDAVRSAGCAALADDA